MKDSKPTVTLLTKLEQANGSVMHGMKKTESTYKGFGEAYFSTVSCGKWKGWKLHKEMTLNLVVPQGDVRFVVHDTDGMLRSKEIIPLLDLVIGESNYSRITVPPGLWLAFQGVGLGKNLLLNIADIEHDPKEAINRSFDFFKIKSLNTST
jgi:dTDP-4-dehydrorhamnose 3,5-epimerase